MITVGEARRLVEEYDAKIKPEEIKTQLESCHQGIANAARRGKRIFYIAKDRVHPEVLDKLITVGFRVSSHSDSDWIEVYW